MKKFKKVYKQVQAFFIKGTLNTDTDKWRITTIEHMIEIPLPEPPGRLIRLVCPISL